MAIKNWGAGSLSMTEISAEFTGGVTPHSLSEYYAGGSLVQAGATGFLNGSSTAIPSSSTISIGHFYGAAKLTASLSPSSQSVTTTQNAAMSSTSTITGTGFVGAITFSISPSLPAGLSLNTSTGVISGTPTTTQAATSYTITGTGATSGSATSTLSLTITAATATLSPSSQTVTGTSGTAITATTAYTASNFVGGITYTISPSLPAGLAISSTTGVISGTPSATSAATSYTVTATGATSGSATATVSITVGAAAAGATFNTTNLNQLAATFSSFGLEGAQDADVSLVFYSNGTFNVLKFGEPPEFGAGGSQWLASGSASAASVRATRTAVSTSGGGAGVGTVTASTGWLSLASDQTVASSSKSNINVGDAQSTWTIEVSIDGGSTVSHTVTGHGQLADVTAAAGGSVSVNAFMPFTTKLAGEFVEGDKLMLLGNDLNSVKDGEVISNRVSRQKLLRMTSSSGIKLTLSDNTPLTLQDGSSINSTEALNKYLPVFDDAVGFRWEEIVSLEEVGYGDVATIYCNDQCYAAGDEPGKYIITHNIALIKN